MTICVFGASITWGAYDPEHGGWVTLLRNYIEKTYQDEVYNLGISGDNTNDLLKRFDAEALAREPELIIFAIGTNDAAYLSKPNNHVTSHEQFEENISLLIQKASAFTKNIVFVGLIRNDDSKTRPVPWATEYFYTYEALQKYDTTLQRITEENNILHIDIYETVLKEDLHDGLHPNTKGHEKIFNAVKDKLEEHFDLSYIK